MSADAGDLEARGEWPLTVAAVLFLISDSWEVLQPGLADPVLLVHLPDLLVVVLPLLRPLRLLRLMVLLRFTDRGVIRTLQGRVAYTP